MIIAVISVILTQTCIIVILSTVAGGGFKPLPPKFRRPSKIVPNSTRLWKLLKIAGFRTPTHQDVREKGSQILKLPPVRNCFTLAMTNKLAVIINSLKVPKIKKILLYELKFLVPNYSCLQNPWLGGYRPQTPVLSVLCPQLNLLTPHTQFLGTPLFRPFCSLRSILTVCPLGDLRHDLNVAGREM